MSVSVPFTAAEYRARAEDLDRRAVRALRPFLSRAYRVQAAQHRLDALMAEYRLSDPPGST